MLVEQSRIRVDNVWRVHCASLHLRWALHYFCCFYAGFLHWLKVSALNLWAISSAPSPPPTYPTFKERLCSELESLYVPNIQGWISKLNSNERSGRKGLHFHIWKPPLPGGGGQIYCTLNIPTPYPGIVAKWPTLLSLGVPRDLSAVTGPEMRSPPQFV